jgi:Sulfotransferase family
VVNTSAPSSERPILVRGLSRSGGTLVVTILDSHPDVAMSYELYPNLLELDDPTPDGVARVIARLRPRRGRRFADGVEPARFATFLKRLPRGGLGPDDVVGVLKAHVAAGRGVGTPADRIRLMQRCAAWKAEREHKPRWGLKCLATYDDYLEVFPHACFVNVIRDGRDVLASTLLEMGTRREVARVANGWASTHRRFRELAARPGVTAHEVVYEDLVRDPEPAIRALCSAVDLPFEPSLLRHNEQPHSVYGASHLSMDRIRKPIDSTSVGRWRRDLSREQIDEFMAIAGDEMVMLGYEP